MSIVRLRKVFRKKIRVGIGKRKLSVGSPMDIIFWGIVVIFVVGAFYTFGGPGGGSHQQAQGPRKVTKHVAVVSGQAISRADFEARYRPRASDVPQAEFVTTDRYLKAGLLDSMIQRLLMLGAAKKENVTVSRADLDNKADELVQQQLDERFPNRKALAKFLRKKQKTVEQYKAELRKRIAEDKTALREMVLFERLEDKVKDRVRISDKDIEDHYTKLKARHILIMPDRLKQDDEQERDDEDEAEPASDKGEQDEAKASAEKKDKPPKKDKDYKALAKTQAEELLARLKKGEDFAELAGEYSHDFSSAEDGGLLHSTRPPPPGAEDEEPSEYFGHGEMVGEFDEAAFALKKDEISDLVETNYGFHIIQVLDRKVEYPEDYEDKKNDYRTELREQKRFEAWSDYQENLKKTAKIEIPDPELAAYRALEDNEKPKAAQLLAQAVQEDPDNVGAKYQLATLLIDGGEKTKAIELLRELTQSEYASSCPQVHMELADLLVEQKLNKEAIEEYKAASEWAQTFDYQSMFLHQQIKGKLEELGDKDLAEQEQKWLDEFNKHMEENPQMGFGQGMPMPITPTPAP